MQGADLARKIAQLLYDRKARDILALKVDHLMVITDYLVLATGSSALQTHALMDHLDQELSALGVQPRRPDRDGGTAGGDHQDAAADPALGRQTDPEGEVARGVIVPAHHHDGADPPDAVGRDHPGQAGRVGQEQARARQLHAAHLDRALVEIGA